MLVFEGITTGSIRRRFAVVRRMGIIHGPFVGPMRVLSVLTELTEFPILRLWPPLAAVVDKTDVE